MDLFSEMFIFFPKLYFLLLCFTFFWSPISAQSADRNGSKDGSLEEPHFPLLNFNWDEVESPFMIGAWLMLASCAKIFFLSNKKLAETVPDSALLIVLGFALGVVLRLCGVEDRIYMFRSQTFFLYLLPPIIFEAGFFIPQRQLLDNFDSIFLFAFVGTIWNTLAIGGTLYWLSKTDTFAAPFTLSQSLLFATCLSSVDPVAVIGVLEDIHVNEFLFINVFGEALFNDGAAVTLYQMFTKFAQIGMSNLNLLDYLEGVLSFVVIAVGGLLLGLIFAIISCITTKYTTQFRTFAPVFVFVVPYMSYLTAEMFGVSSILALIACAIAMKKYVKQNLCRDSYTSIKYFVKLVAQCAETVIFLFLGLSIVSQSHLLDWDFAFAAILFCLLYRIIGVVIQCAVLNRFRSKKFTCTDQFFLSYGGLRGAISFGLVISVDSFPARPMFITTTLAVIFFTVFVQGISIRPLLFWLKVERATPRLSTGADGFAGDEEPPPQLPPDDDDPRSGKTLDRYTDYAMTGLDTIYGAKARSFLRDAFKKHILTPMRRNSEESKPLVGNI